MGRWRARLVVAMTAAALLGSAPAMVPRSEAAPAPTPAAPPAELGWAVRISSRAYTSSVLHQVALPDGAVLALVDISAPIGIDREGVRLGAAPNPGPVDLAVLRITGDGHTAWISAVASVQAATGPGATAMVRTGDGRVRVLVAGQGTVHTTPPVAFPGGIAVAEVDPTTGAVLRGGHLAAGVTGEVHADAADDDLVVSGTFRTQAWLGLGTPRTVLTTRGTGVARFGTNVFVARLDPDLHVRWAQSLGPSGATRGLVDDVDVTASSDGTTHVLCEVVGTIALSDGRSLPGDLARSRPYWLRFGPDGTPLGWTQFADAPGMRHIVPGGSPGTVVLQLTGGTPLTILEGPSPGPVPGATTSRGGMLVGFDASGTLRWAQQALGFRNDDVPVVPDGDGTLAVLRAQPSLIGTDRSIIAGMSVPFELNVAVRYTDDGTPSSLGTLPPYGVSRVGRGGDGSLVVSGTGTGAIRLGARAGAPILAGSQFSFVAGGVAPPPGTGTLRGTVTGGSMKVTVMTGPPTFRAMGTVATAPDGSWSMAGLPPGGYRVRAVPTGRSSGTWFPAGADLSGAAVVQVPDGGTAVADVDVAEVPVGTVLVSVMVGAAGGRNVAVQLFTPSGGFVASGVVQNLGTYGLLPARVVVPAGVPYQMRIVDPVLGTTSWHGSTDGTRAGATAIVPAAGATTPISVALPG